MRLSEYVHDRTRNVSKTVPELFTFIENFTKQKSVLKWYSWFEDNFKLPGSVIDQYVKKILADNFNYGIDKGFNRNLIFSFSIMIKEVSKYIVFINYIMIRRKVKIDIQIEKTVILDHIEWEETLQRYKKFISLFKTENVVTIVPHKDKFNSNNFEIMYRPKYINYRITFKEYFTIMVGVLFHFTKSRNIGVNIFGITINIINSYFYYRTLFELVNAEYIINQQHYHTDAIKNYLFKKMGGKCSATIQKNLHQQGHNGFYYDSDIFFSIGEGTAVRAFKLGARLGKVVAVGSFFMEYHWFEQNKLINNKMQKYDILCIGYNVGEYHNIYDKYYDDYYEHFIWLSRLIKNYPNLDIGIIHHPKNEPDPKEMDIIADTGIERIDPDINSYALGFKSGINVTYGSTMGYEFIGHNKPCFFLDPENRNTQFLPDGNELGEFRIKSYNQFEKLVLGYLSKNNNAVEFDSDRLCLDSSNVSLKIYQSLKNYN